MRILHLENDANDIELVRQTLHGSGGDWQVLPVDNRGDFVRALTEGVFDAVIADFNVPGFGGLEALTLARQLTPMTPFIFFSGTIGEDQAVAALQAGAADYVLKDRMKRLAPAVRRVVADQHERRRRAEAETSLFASQARYERLVDQAQDAIFSLSLDGKITSLNPAFEKITGWTRHQWIGRPFADLVHEPDRLRARDVFELVRQRQRPGPFELGLNSAGGAPVPVEFTASFSPLAQRSGEILGIGRDLSARKRAERLIREQAGVIDHAPVAITIIDAGNRITYWNRGATLLYGWSEPETLGQPLEKFQPPETLEALREGRELIARDSDWRGEVPLASKDGRRLHAEFTLSPIHDEHGGFAGHLAIALDVTEKKRLQEQFLRSHRMENLGLLAAGIAHDFNNILSPIVMIAQLLRDEGSADARGRLLDTLEQSAQRGAALVQQILGFAQGNADGHRVVNLKPLARDVIRMIEETFPKNIRFHHEVASDLQPIRGHLTHLHQVLLNLCVNARDAMPEGGDLSLRLVNAELTPDDDAALPRARPGAFVLIEVRDTGSGIPPQVLPHIWEPFFTTKSGHGTGLGLSTVRGILRNHEAFAEVASAAGAGTSFRLYFPAEPLPADEPAPKPAAADLPRGNGELIMIVEDEPGVRDLVQAILQRQGYQSLAARDGIEAMNLLRLQPTLRPRVVITDFMMPHLGGQALVPLLRREVPGIKIIAMSGLGSPEPAPDATDIGDAFLLKPFKPDALLGTLHRLLQRPARQGN